MKTEIVEVKSLKPEQRQRLFQIMNLYYDNLSREQFEIDLNEKTHVILLLERSRKLCGFSTLLKKRMVVDGKSIIALYSGDTVLDREYWGNGALGLAFGRYLTRVKWENLTTPVYWFLISKGYKTYLLMTNNFPTHYPRYEKPTPAPIQKIMKAFYSEKFGDLYREHQSLVVPQGVSCALKVRVADIDESLLKHPRIAFFAERNIHWQKGHELACVAQVTLWIPIRYILKRIRKSFMKIFKPVALTADHSAKG